MAGSSMSTESIEYGTQEDKMSAVGGAGRPASGPVVSAGQLHERWRQGCKVAALRQPTDLKSLVLCGIPCLASRLAGGSNRVGQPLADGLAAGHGLSGVVEGWATGQQRAGWGLVAGSTKETQFSGKTCALAEDSQRAA